MNTTKPTTDEVAPSAAPKKTKSKGERVFDWGVYGGIAGVGTFVATVPIAYAMKHTRVGSKYYQGLVDGLHHLAEKIAPRMLSKKVAEDAVMTTSLMMGGNAMLLPVDIAEKHKVTTVAGLNTMLGDPTPPENVEQQPQQTLGSLVKARLVAWATVFSSLFTASSLFPKSFTTFENEFSERACKLLGKPTEMLKEGKMLPSRAFLLGKISALDVFATAASAILLYVAGHTFARKREEKIERRQHSAHAHAGPVQTDEAPSMEAVSNDAPQLTIEGARSLEGKTRELASAIAAQV